MPFPPSKHPTATFHHRLPRPLSRHNGLFELFIGDKVTQSRLWVFSSLLRNHVGRSLSKYDLIYDQEPFPGVTSCAFLTN